MGLAAADVRRSNIDSATTSNRAQNLRRIVTAIAVVAGTCGTSRIVEFAEGSSAALGTGGRRSSLSLRLGSEARTQFSTSLGVELPS